MTWKSGGKYPCYNIVYLEEGKIGLYFWNVSIIEMIYVLPPMCCSKPVSTSFRALLEAFEVHVTPKDGQKMFIKVWSDTNLSNVYKNFVPNNN